MNIKAFFRESEYLKKVAALFSATVLGQAIPFLLAPVLSRLYSPSDYSELGIYIVCVSILSAIGTLKIDQAILIPEENSSSVQLAKTSLSSLVLISIIATPILYLSGFFTFSFSLYIGVGSFVMGFISIFLQLSNRFNHNKNIGMHKVTLGSGVSFAQVLLSSFPRGLVSGKLLGDFISILPFVIRFRKELLHVKRFPFSIVWNSYKNFPTITLPHTLFNLIGNRLPVIVFSYLGYDQLSGEFENVYRLGMAPITIVASTIYLSFSSKFAELKNSNQKAKSFLTKNIKALIITVVIPFTLISASSPYVLPYVLGSQWANAGIFFVLMTPLMIATILTGPFVYIPQYANKQKNAFLLEIGINGFKVIGLFIGLKFSVYWGLFLFSIFGSIGYGIFMTYIYKLVKELDENGKP